MSTGAAPGAIRETDIPHARFWLVLAGFVVASWLLDRLFGQLVSWLGLDNSTRELHAHWSSGAWRPIVENLALHWLPKCAAITALAWVMFRMVGLSPRRALFAPLEARRAWVVFGAFTLLGLYHWARWRIEGSASTPRPDPSSTFLGVYLLRFAPSAWVEEVTFRAVLFGAVRARYSLRAAWPVSVALFVAVHSYGGPALVAHALFVGVVLTAVYDRARSLWACAALHAASNLLHAVFEYTA